VCPLYEELSSTCALIAKEYDDVAGRRALLDDPDWQALFRKEWYHGRNPDKLDWPTLKAKWGLPDLTVIRSPELLVFDGAPVKDWDGETFAQVLARLEGFQTGDASAARSEEERMAFKDFPNPIVDDAEFMLHLLRTWDKNFRFYVDQANVGNRATLNLLLDDCTLPGFNDSGAHITNMAFFDGNLGSLKRAQEKDLATVSRMVQRLTSEPADFFGLDVGSLKIGAQADLVLIDPEALAKHECDASRQTVQREVFDHEQMVNRPDGVVSRVFIKGATVWDGTDFAADYGSRPLGRALRAA
ncbi:MAG: amidohydrolase family protein, partial [Pseudomonadales bacterium]